MSTPKITVLMPVYNAAAYLSEAIDSILSQTFTDFEFLIIDDGSTDESASIISSYDDQRIRLITHATNKGLIATLNEGVAVAQAPLVARMDADDRSLPTRLQQQYDFLKQNPEIVLLGTEAAVIGPDGSWRYDQTTLANHEALWRLLAVACPFVHGSVIFRKAAVEQVGGYRDQAYTAEDYDLWLRLAAVGKIANLQERLYEWRLNPTSESHTKAWQQRQTCQRLGDEQWLRFSKTGPAERSVWPIIWSSEELRRPPVASRRRQLAHFHIYFARSYRRHGNYGQAMAHLFAAWQLQPTFLPFYFYYLALPLLPIQFALWLEQQLLTIRLRRQP